MSAIDNSEVSHTVDLDEVKLAEVLKHSEKSEKHGIRKPKRILHFSDGTMEEDDDEESDEDNHPHLGDGVEEPIRKSNAEKRSLESALPVNPKSMSWPSWVKHYSTTGGTKTLNFLDNVGETFAYYLGITTPKYQYEIDEYNRMKQDMKEEKKAEAVEFASWATVPPTDTPIVTEKKSEQTQQPEAMTSATTTTAETK